MDLRGSFNPSYFSLQEILAQNLKVPCVTEVTLPQFGFLDPSQQSDDLPANTKVELPLWAARVMSHPQRQYVRVTIPKLYQEAYREALKADPSVVDLNKMGPNFYESGVHLSGLNHHQAEDVGDVLPKVLQIRLRSMADSFSYQTKLKVADEETCTTVTGAMKETHMDALERKIFEDSKNAYRDLLSWLEK